MNAKDIKEGAEALAELAGGMIPAEPARPATEPGESGSEGLPPGAVPLPSGAWNPGAVKSDRPPVDLTALGLPDARLVPPGTLSPHYTVRTDGGPPVVQVAESAREAWVDPEKAAATKPAPTEFLFVTPAELAVIIRDLADDIKYAENLAAMAPTLKRVVELAFVAERLLAKAEAAK